MASVTFGGVWWFGVGFLSYSSILSILSYSIVHMLD